jgi:hypothetical protein
MINQSPKYRGLLEAGNRVAKQAITPYGIYKISTYNYVDEGRQTLKGPEETLIFVTGIYQRKVSALKLSNIEPLKFLNWLKKIVGTNSYNEGMKRIDELKTPFDIGGNRIYDTYIRNNKDFVAKGAAYRTYNLDGIQYATEMFLNEKTLKQYYG